MLTNFGEEIVEIDDAHAQPILDVLKQLTGITIPVQKKMMVVFRLRKRLAELDTPLSDYVARVRHDRREQQTFINLLTTNETSFFRTLRVWKYFREQFLPEFLASKASEILRVWSAAASTGEEAGSIAMSCHDFQLSHPSFRFQVLATDVDTEVLAKAESGVYSAKTIDKLRETDPEMFRRYFKENRDGLHEIDAQLKSKIKFATHNLMESPRLLAPQHIVFLRNVLIYFREQEQMTILKQIGSTMAPGTILILGESESISALETPFAFVQPQIYRKLA
ncbi:chemotaxis protein methyltransferase CheR [Silvibacterium bohemicum]|uniref:protein-glutamate O-methyltransferase n=1 Tax=Silvibacterium bohemicum TaxID=1577686 RepID=A0A841JRV7_9BACT|nr:protein-glutamate O-methyltransferase CheR [Silvibacterium bohemicum]MBB6144143.1 chemotaxis protein methyltransferase CheR [Silvibacterium bohemicum]